MILVIQPKQITFVVMKRGFSIKKAVQALNLFATLSGGSLNKMKALKLVWLADRYHLRKYGRTILGDHYVAMEHGPVASSTRNVLEKSYFTLTDLDLAYADQFITPNGKEYKTIQKPVEKVFSKSDLEALNAIFDAYGKMDKYTLRDLSHEFPEWKKFEQGFKKKLFKAREMDLNDFFLQASPAHPLFNADQEELDLVQELFQGETKQK